MDGSGVDGSGRRAGGDGSADRRTRILAAAADLFARFSIARTGRRDVAAAADVAPRAVGEIADDRVALLREVVADLPYPPTSQMIADQAAHPTQTALQALMQAARDVLGDPGAAWDPLELQAITIAPYDGELGDVVRARLERRWAAARGVAGRLHGGTGSAPADDAVALHLIAVGLGLAMLGPVRAHDADARAWTALSGRLLEALVEFDAAPVGADPFRWRARVTMPAAPSAVAAMLRVLARLGVHVVSLFTAALDGDRQLVDMFLASAPGVDRATIVHALSGVADDVIVARGIPADADDVATRVLRLSTRLAADPDSAPRAAADLVLADSWEVTSAVAGIDAAADVLRLQWTPERHVILRRTAAPFTRAERDRASALLALVGALSQVRGDIEGFGWRLVLPDGDPVAIRLARPEDAERVERMHGRCSEQSRFQRYFTPMSTWRDDNLRRIAGGHRGATLVVSTDDGEVVALGNVFPTEPGTSDVAEIAVIVEDAWHGRGIGLALMGHLIDVARRMGFTRLIAYVLAENTAMRALLDATGLTWTVTADHDLGPTVVALVADLT